MTKRKKKIGLVLGSGAARGWAHLGVLQVLDELDLPVHCVTGTSIGALVGGFYASGRLQELRKVALELDWKKSLYYFLEMSFPRSGLIDGRRVVEFVREHVREVAIDDLDIPFAAVATDVLTGSEEVMKEGSLIDAIRASISIPGIFTPLTRGKSVLVDGGLVNPVPVDVARDMGAEIVIAVDLNGSVPGCKSAAVEKTPDILPAEARENGMAALQNRILKKVNTMIEESDLMAIPSVRRWMEMQELPNIFDVIGNSIRIMEKQVTAMRLKIDKPDILIQPDVADVDFMGFHLAAKGIQAGIEATNALRPRLCRACGIGT